MSEPGSDEGLPPFPEHMTPLDPRARVRVETLRSIWFIEPDAQGPGGRYLRMPKVERPRAQPPSHDGRLDDGVWHRYRRAQWTEIAHPYSFHVLDFWPEEGPHDEMSAVGSSPVLRVIEGR